MNFEKHRAELSQESYEELSLKTIAFRFPHGSVERALLHGRWRGTRGKGKGPTLLFGNHKDPRAAYESAEEMLGDYFDEIFQQDYSRRSFFWTRKMVRRIQGRVPVSELPLPAEYR